MRRRWSYAAVFVAALTILGSGTATEARGQYSRRTPIVEAVQKTRAGIVTIKVEKKGSRGRNEKSVGTGVVVDARGYVVSNRHVIAGAAHLSVCLEDGTELDARVAAEDVPSDLAILRVQAGKRLHALPLGPGSDLMVGETVIAVGHPFGYTHTVSTGIISAVGRQIVLPTGEVLSNLIQTDASINPGNSGGPLLNINGELIGINVALREGAQGIAFAINVDTVEQVLRRHLSALKVAGVNHGLICSESIAAEGQQRQRVVVDAVAQQMPASASSLKRGDQILRVAEQSVANRFDIERALWDRKPGEQITLTVVRQGKQLTVGLRLTPAVQTVRSP